MNTTCKNCGADEGLHHYQTNQCPVGGREAPIGRKQEWKTTTYEPIESALVQALSRAEAAENRAAQIEAELKSACEAADIDNGMPLDEWIISARNDHIVMTNDRNVAQAELDDTIKQRKFWFDKFNEIASERDMYKQGFDALTTVCDQIVAERDYLQRRVESLQGALNTVDRALAQHQQTRRELLETIAELKRENEQLQSEIDYLRSTDHAADLAFERAQKIGAAYVIAETPLGQSLDGQGDEVEP